VGAGNGALGRGVTKDEETMTDMNTAEEYCSAADNLQEKGMPDEAISFYLKAIEIEPKFAEAHNNLGNAYRKKGRRDEAIQHYRSAIALDPGSPAAYFHLGIVFQENGESNASAQCYRKALELDPEHSRALLNLGVCLDSRGMPEEALLCYQRALELDPTDPIAHYNLGNIFKKMGLYDEAIRHFREAVLRYPGYTEAHYNLGVSLYEKGDPDNAGDCFRTVISLSPGYAGAYYNLGNVLKDKGQTDEAILCFEKAIALNSDYAEAHNNLGNIYKDSGNPAAAMKCYRRAIEINPSYSGAYFNLGNTLKEQREFAEAMHCFRKAVEHSPDYAEAHWNLSLLLLAHGNFAEGWKEYEWRWKLKGVSERAFPQPLWDGSALDDRTILLHAEQGLGDAIHFIRYAPLLAERGARVLVECQKELAPLFRNISGLDQVIAGGEKLPAFDVHCPLLSLPLVFGTEAQSIPATVPYIIADAALAHKWKERMQAGPAGFRVGLVWSGSPVNKQLRYRSCSLHTFSPLAQLAGDTLIFYSLQKGIDAQQAKAPPEGMRLIDYTDELQDFSDTAALIENLDLVISIDTSVSHLAGALGRPVWTLLHRDADWRWLLDREDSRWYPTMRLFRQDATGQWDTAVSLIVEELKRLSYQGCGTVPSVRAVQVRDP
jgi:tetratricopeptide (TPR) repeat protein